MKKNKKGFTLIELLATIAVLAIILLLGFVFYGNYINATKLKAEEIEKEQIVNAAKMFYTEFENTDGYLSYTMNDDNNKEVKYSCVSIKSLIEKGYYKETDVNIKSKETDVVEVKEVDGVVNYKYINQYSSDSHCSYWEEGQSLSDDNIVVDYNGIDGSGVNVDTNIEKSDDNTYKLKLKIDSSLGNISYTEDYPVYILFVVDSSRSMGDFNFNRVVESIKGFAESIGQNNSINRYYVFIGVINFAEGIKMAVPFTMVGIEDGEYVKKLIQQYVNYGVLGNHTNILGALDKATDEIDFNYKGFDENVNKKAIRYVVFLTDGEPGANSYVDDRCDYYNYLKNKKSCLHAIDYRVNELKNRHSTNFIMIGYNVSIDMYKTLPTIDNENKICPGDSDYTDSNGNKYCYFESNSSGISSLFNNISTSVVHNVVSRVISGVKVTAKLSENITIEEIEGNDFMLDIAFEEFIDSSNEYEYTVVFNDANWDITEDDIKNGKVSRSFNVLDDYKIDFIKDNTTIKSDKLNSPIITVTKNLKSYLN